MVSESLVNTFQQLVAERYSCRNFSEREPSSELILQLLEIAKHAPSACNQQPYHFYIVSKDSLEKLTQVRPWYGAPLVILACATSELCWTRTFDKLNCQHIDLGLIVDQLALAATAAGLQSCIIASFNPEQVQEVLDIPPEHLPVLALAVGYAKENDAPSIQHSQRKSNAELFSFKY